MPDIASQRGLYTNIYSGMYRNPRTIAIPLVNERVDSPGLLESYIGNMPPPRVTVSAVVVRVLSRGA